LSGRPPGARVALGGPSGNVPPWASRRDEGSLAFVERRWTKQIRRLIQPSASASGTRPAMIIREANPGRAANPHRFFLAEWAVADPAPIANGPDTAAPGEGPPRCECGFWPRFAGAPANRRPRTRPGRLTAAVLLLLLHRASDMGEQRGNLVGLEGAGAGRSGAGAAHRLGCRGQVARAAPHRRPRPAPAIHVTADRFRWGTMADAVPRSMGRWAHGRERGRDRWRITASGGRAAARCAG